MDAVPVFPLLETERLILKKLCPQDVDFIYRHFSNQHVCEFLFDNEPLTSIEGAHAIIDFYADAEQMDRNRWVIFSKESSEPIGTCGYHRWDRADNIAEIGYDLEREFWGHGYMHEAMQAALEVGFDHMHLNRVQAFVSVQNSRSVKVLKRLGFSEEGIIRDKHYFRGAYYDHFCLSLLKREWSALHTANA